jgi:hypothetical protein
MVYRLRENYRIPVPADVAGAELERLAGISGGELTPPRVVESAKKKSSPIHDCFEWDNSEAAQRYREEQARYLIRSVVVVYSETEPTKEVRAFVNVMNEESAPSYRPIGVVMEDRALRAQVLERARMELAGWRRRYSELQEYAEVFSAIDKAVALPFLAATAPKPEHTVTAG